MKINDYHFIVSIQGKRINYTFEIHEKQAWDKVKKMIDFIANYEDEME